MAVEHEVETQSSILAFGWRGNQSVVLKVIRNHGDEWHSGDLDAFDGNGVVRVLDRFDGAVLLEHLQPGDSLVGMAINGNDDQATGILADVIGRMYPRAPDEPLLLPSRSGLEGSNVTQRASTVKFRGRFSMLRNMCIQLCRHKPNRGCSTATSITTTYCWMRSVDGSPSTRKASSANRIQVGAALRNPYERPKLFTAPAIIERRVDRFARELHLDPGGFWRGRLHRRCSRPSGPSRTALSSGRTMRGSR